MVEELRRLSPRSQHRQRPNLGIDWLLRYSQARRAEVHGSSPADQSDSPARDLANHRQRPPERR